MAKYEEIKQGTIFPAGVLNPYGDFFVGDTYLTNLVTSPDDKIGVGSVSFEPGSHNNWHIHRDGYQILLVTAGEGWYQEEGQPAKCSLPALTVMCWGSTIISTNVRTSTS